MWEPDLFQWFLTSLEVTSPLKIVSHEISSLHQKTVDSHTVLLMSEKRVADCSEAHPWTSYTPSHLALWLLLSPLLPDNMHTVFLSISRSP